MKAQILNVILVFLKEKVDMKISDVASEKAVLAGMVQHGSNGYADVADLITIETFTLESNQMIYKCLEYILKDKVGMVVDLPTIYAAASSLGFSHIFEKEDERRHLRAIMNFPINQANVRAMAKRIRKLQIARNASTIVEDIKSNLINVTGDEPIAKSWIGFSTKPRISSIGSSPVKVSGSRHLE
jgi:replicative DNA helicase